jgi:1-acyl-sn-glycerol-3-phosphate acyltransferase
MARAAHRFAATTVFRTPVVRPVLARIAAGILRLLGWSSRVRVPDVPKCLIVLAPHTSYWDFALLLAFALRHGVDAHWLGTHNLFRGPGGPLFRWLGGIPVDRTRRNGLVGAVVDAFESRDRLMVALAPEGSRYRRKRWKTGFHRIAEGAGVPVWLVGMDYPSRTIVADTLVWVTGNLDADLRRLGEFFSPLRGKRPRWQTPPLGSGG